MHGMNTAVGSLRPRRDPSTAMMTNFRTRWYSHLRSQGYRPKLPPSKLLALSLANARREPELLQAMLSDSRIELLTSFQATPELLANHIAAHSTQHSLSLSIPENTLSLETSILAFTAALSRMNPLPPWLLLETYLGRVVRKFTSVLRTPDSAKLAWWLHESLCDAQLTAAIARVEQSARTKTWPTPADCQHLADALHSLMLLTELPLELRAPLIKTARIFSSLAEGGVPGLFLTYMLAVCDRTEQWCQAKTPGRRGPMQSLADDVAAPISRWQGDTPRPHRRTSRRPLHVARLDTITGRHWCRQGEAWEFSGHSRELLVEFDTLASASTLTHG